MAMHDEYRRTGSKQRLIGEFSQAAPSWPHERRVITRLEWGEQGHSPRFIVTNLDADAATLCDHVYCQRGEAGNRMKEAQVGLFATRTSCHVLASNRLRVLLAAPAYVLIERMRALALRALTAAITACHRINAVNTPLERLVSSEKPSPRPYSSTTLKHAG